MAEAPKHVLVVEDEQATADILKFNLELRGYSSECAYDGDEAIRMAAARVPDLMILDINMPGMSGWEVLDLLPEDEEMSVVPVVILSGRDTLSDIKMGWSYEIVAYFTKPFDMTELMDLVDRVLAGERVEGE